MLTLLAPLALLARRASSLSRLAALFIFALAAASARGERPEPDRANVAYGPHERNVLDFWAAKSDKPAPLMLFIHGGGFVGGDKKNIDSRLLDHCLKNGVSVASTNYRYSTQAPYPAPFLDSARAIQFLRSNAKEWGFDPSRVAACGGSAGAGISLWLGFHDDLADPKNADPVLRESTRLTCMGVIGAQCSYDPRFVKEQIGGRAYEHPALPKLFGIEPKDLDSPKPIHDYEDSAPINHLNAGDPPVFMIYSESKEPLPPGPNKGATLHYPEYGKKIEGAHSPGQGIHHPKFGELLKAKMDPIGIECVIFNTTDHENPKGAMAKATEEMAGFLRKHLAER